MKLLQGNSQSEVSHVRARACSVRKGGCEGVISQVGLLRSYDGLCSFIPLCTRQRKRKYSVKWGLFPTAAPGGLFTITHKSSEQMDHAEAGSLG